MSNPTCKNKVIVFASNADCKLWHCSASRPHSETPQRSGEVLERKFDAHFYKKYLVWFSR